MVPKDPNPKTLGERLRLLRERAKLSQRDLGEKSGVGKSSVDRIEKGEQAPTAARVQALADALHVDPRELLTGGIQVADMDAAIEMLEAAEAKSPVVRPTPEEIAWLRSLRLTWSEVEPSVEMMRAFIEGKRRAGI